MRIIADTGWIGASKASAVVYLVLFNYLLIRILPLEIVGQFFVIYSVIVVLPSIMLLGANIGVVKIIAEARAIGDTNGHESLFSNVRFVFLVGSGILAVAGWLGGVTIARLNDSHIDYSLASALIIWLISAQARLLVAGVARGNKDFRRGALVENIVYHLGATAGLTLLFAYDVALSLDDVIWLCALSSLAPVLLDLCLLVSRNIRGEQRKPAIRLFGGPLLDTRNGEFKSFIALSAMLMMTTLFPVLLNQSGLWLAAAANGDESAGLYGVAFRLMQVAAFPSMVYGILIRPYIADFLGDRRPVVVQATAKATRFFFGIYLLASIILVIFGSELIELLFGAEYSDMYWVMVVLIIGRLAYAVFGPSEIVMSFLGQERYAVYSSYAIAIGLLSLWFLIFDASLVSIAAALSLVFFVRSALLWWKCVLELAWDTSIFGGFSGSTIRETT